MTSSVDFGGWRARPGAQLTATTSKDGGWNAAYQDALAVLADGSRKPAPATVRALAIGGAIASAWLRGQATEGADGTLVCRTDQLTSGGAAPDNGSPPDPAREEAARIFDRSLETILLARCPAPQTAKAIPPRMILAPGGAVEAAGPLPWPQIVVIAAIVGVVAYAVHEAGAVADRWIEERARTLQLDQNHATASELVRKHIEREREAGHDLPLDEATRLALKGLGAEQQATAARLAAPRTSVSVDGGALGAGFGTLALLAAAALFAFSQK